jgi:hypothetical protein
MATTLIGYGKSGVTHDFFAYNANGAVWNGTAFVTPAAADFATYRIAAAETATGSRRYVGTAPAGAIWYELRRRGASLAASSVVYEDEVEGAAELISGQTGTPLPPTRTLRAVVKTGTPPAVTNTDGNVVWFRNIRRQDNGVSVMVDTLATQVATGVYDLVIPENGWALLYDEEFTVGGVPFHFDKTSFAPPAAVGGNHYASEADVDLELGKANADINANLSSSNLYEDSPLYIEDSLVAADRWINRELREAGVLIPLTTNGNSDDYAYSLGQINDAARKYAAGTLLNKREGQSRTAGQKTNGDVLKEQAEEIMDELVEAGAPGLTTATVGDLDLNDIGMVTAGASVTPDGLPKPPRCSYGYYDRLYGGWVYR